MPFIDISLIEGRTPDQLRSLIREVTDAAVRTLEVPKDSVRVVLRELPATHWAAGDVTLQERRSNQS